MRIASRARRLARPASAEVLPTAVHSSAISFEASIRTSGAGSGRSGLTLLELMIVTVILAILALIAVRPLREARENAMVAAARSEVREVSGALSRQQVVTGLLPDNVGALESA